MAILFGTKVTHILSIRTGKNLRLYFGYVALALIRPYFLSPKVIRLSSEVSLYVLCTLFQTEL